MPSQALRLPELDEVNREARESALGYSGSDQYPGTPIIDSGSPLRFARNDESVKFRPE